MANSSWYACDHRGVFLGGSIVRRSGRPSVLDLQEGKTMADDISKRDSKVRRHLVHSPVCESLIVSVWM